MEKNDKKSTLYSEVSGISIQEDNPFNTQSPDIL